MVKKILIADDHPTIRVGVKNILSAALPDILFDEAVNRAEVFTKISSGNWQLLILDIDFPDGSGLSVLDHIRKEEINLPVLVFSFHREEQLAIRALRSGASGFLSKDAGDKELVNAIRQILSGRKYFSQAVTEQLLTHVAAPSSLAPHDTLSGREYQVLLMIAKGKIVSEISTELGISVSTVHTYRSRILEKMELKTNAQLTNYVFKNNLA
jgi:two-component system, NarL family, invasion response regulator UvrY